MFYGHQTTLTLHKFFNMEFKGSVKITLGHTAGTFSRRGTAAEPHPLPLPISRCLFTGLQEAIVKEPVITSLYKPSLQSSVCFITSSVHSASGQWSLSFFFIQFLRFFCHMWPRVCLCIRLFTETHACIVKTHILKKHMCGSLRWEWRDCCYITTNQNVHKIVCSACQLITNDAAE